MQYLCILMWARLRWVDRIGAEHPTHPQQAHLERAVPTAAYLPPGVVSWGHRAPHRIMDNL